MCKYKTFSFTKSREVLLTSSKGRVWWDADPTRPWAARTVTQALRAAGGERWPHPAPAPLTMGWVLRTRTRSRDRQWELGAGAVWGWVLRSGGDRAAGQGM